MGRGPRVVLTELPIRLAIVWRIVQIFPPIVLLLLLLERTRTGKQVDAGQE